MAGQTFEDFVRQLRLPRPLTIAELVDSTVGGVKAALNRARTKLAESSPPAKSARSASPELKRIMQLYVDRFNRRDWAGVRQLTSVDARLTVAERFAGKFVTRLILPITSGGLGLGNWEVGEVDGEPVVIILQRGADTWAAHSAIRLDVIDQRIERIVDYIHLELPAATTVTVAKA